MPRFYKVKKKFPRTSKRSTTSAIVIKAKKSSPNSCIQANYN